MRKTDARMFCDESDKSFLYPYRFHSPVKSIIIKKGQKMLRLLRFAYNIKLRALVACEQTYMAHVQKVKSDSLSYFILRASLSARVEDKPTDMNFPVKGERKYDSNQRP